MRVAIFTETFLPKIDGIVTRLTHTVRHLVASGDQVMVVAPALAGTPRQFAGAKVFGAQGYYFPLYPELRLAPPHRSIRVALEGFQPELVHVVNPAVLGAAGIYYAGEMGLPLVASYHTHVPKYLRHYRLGWLEGPCWRLLRAMHNRAKLNLCTSTVMIQELSQHGIRHLELWPRAVDTELFRPDLRSEETRSELLSDHGNGDARGTLLLYVGRLAPEKEIERIRAVLEAIPGSSLALVGDGPHRGRLEKHFAGSSARFVGYRTGRRLAAAFASADALIFPSRTETLGLVVLEAMAAGCPVVAARAGGITDIIQDGENGCLFEPSSDEDLVSAARNLLGSPERWAMISQRGRQEAERWGWAATTSTLRDYYQGVVNGSKGATHSVAP